MRKNTCIEYMRKNTCTLIHLNTVLTRQCNENVIYGWWNGEREGEGDDSGVSKDGKGAMPS